MIIVAFAALVLVVVLQAFYLNRAEQRMQIYQVEARRAREIAEHELVRAEQQLADAHEMLEQAQAEAKVTGEAAKRGQTEKGKQP